MGYADCRLIVRLTSLLGSAAASQFGNPRRKLNEIVEGTAAMRAIKRPNESEKVILRRRKAAGGGF